MRAGTALLSARQDELWQLETREQELEAQLGNNNARIQWRIEVTGILGVSEINSIFSN